MYGYRTAIRAGEVHLNHTNLSTSFSTYQQSLSGSILAERSYFDGPLTTPFVLGITVIAYLWSTSNHLATKTIWVYWPTWV